MIKSAYSSGYDISWILLLSVDISCRIMNRPDPSPVVREVHLKFCREITNFSLQVFFSFQDACFKWAPLNFTPHITFLSLFNFDYFFSKNFYFFKKCPIKIRKKCFFIRSSILRGDPISIPRSSRRCRLHVFR